MLRDDSKMKLNKKKNFISFLNKTKQKTFRKRSIHHFKDGILRLSSSIKHFPSFDVSMGNKRQRILSNSFKAHIASHCFLNTIKTINGHSIYAGTWQFVSVFVFVHSEPFMTPLQKQSNKLFNDWAIVYRFTLHSLVVSRSSGHECFSSYREHKQKI